MKLLRNGTSIERGTIDRQKRFDYSRRTVSALRNRTIYVYGSGLTAITRYLRPRKLYNRFPNENRCVLGICATGSLTKRRQTLRKSAASKSSIETHVGWQIVFLRLLGEKKRTKSTKNEVQSRKRFYEMLNFTFVSWQLSLEAVPWFMVIDDDASQGT